LTILNVLNALRKRLQLSIRPFVCSIRQEGPGVGNFNIFLNKGFGPNFLKVVRRRISRRRSSSNNNRGRRRAWELTRWWECAHAVATTICYSSFLSPPPL
jgi:hypothetical protein